MEWSKVEWSGVEWKVAKRCIRMECISCCVVVRAQASEEEMKSKGEEKRAYLRRVESEER